MILSMTGFGEGKGTYKEKNITIEIRSLNGKSTDIRMKTPASYKEKELELRKLIIKHALRGKFDVVINYEAEEGSDEYGLNKALFSKYYNELISLKSELQFNDEGIAAAILRIPNVIQANVGELSDEEWEVVKATTTEALENLQRFRASDGKGMEQDFKDAANNISDCLKAVEPYEKARIVQLKERMERNLEEFMGKQNVDKNRYEQEVMFYLEKLDINEEKVRLEQHCKFFLEELNGKDIKSKGKKLGFISQEMGREINTLGSKAQNSEIQKLVVRMKDELERIKEQIANVV